MNACRRIRTPARISNDGMGQCNLLLTFYSSNGRIQTLTLIEQFENHAVDVIEVYFLSVIYNSIFMFENLVVLCFLENVYVLYLQFKDRHSNSNSHTATLDIARNWATIKLNELCASKKL